jgi:hypothetical protein
MKKLPSNLHCLIDGDILRYEVGFAAEAGWREITGEESVANGGTPPPFDYVRAILEERIDLILAECKTKDFTFYLTEGETFRFKLYDQYKAKRKGNKPWHYLNLTHHMYDVMGATKVTEIEADDAISVAHVARDDTIICSRDKDLRQVPGWFYSWELGRQPAFGPEEIRKTGSLSLSNDRRKLTGTGLPFFYSQVLTGDVVDNIPGLPKWGPVATYQLLVDETKPDILFDAVHDVYAEKGFGDDYLLLQGRLCWMTRSLHEDGTPVLWELGMEE